MMIEKIISFAFLESNKKYEDVKIQKHCSLYVRTLSDIFMGEARFRYDRDDILPEEARMKKMFFGSIYHGVNNWDEIDEPVLLIV
jgi:hypothetical protein